MIVYHATPITCLSRILEQGLRLGMPRNWSDASGRKQGSRTHLYYCTSETSGIRWAYRMQFDLGRATALLVIDLERIAHEPDPHIENRLNGLGWIRSGEALPPQRIEQVLTLSPARIRRAVAELHGGAAAA